MEELTGIISIISKHTGVSRADITDSMSQHAALARAITCHIIREGFPHLMKSFQDMANISAAAFYKAIRRALLNIETDDRLLYLVNEIRRELTMPVLKICQEPKIPVSLQIFGFKWSDLDILRRRRAIRASARYMDKYCSYGRQPVEAGMVRTRRRICHN